MKPEHYALMAVVVGIVSVCIYQERRDREMKRNFKYVVFGFGFVVAGFIAMLLVLFMKLGAI